MASSKKVQVLALSLGASLAASGAFLAACSTDNSNSAPPVYGDDGGDATAITPTPDASPDGGGQTPEGGSPDTGADAPSGSSGGGDAGDAGSDAPTVSACTSALTDAGCWTCPSASDGSVEFLNQCAGTGVRCVPFNNLANLPGFDAGLPPL
jgi:hypothetical protein